MEAGRIIGGGRYRQKLFQAEREYIRDSNMSLLALSEKYNMEPSTIGRVRREMRQVGA